MEEVKPWTTYRDIQNRYWVIIDLNYWGIHEQAQDTIQAVVMYQVGTPQVTTSVSYGTFLSMIEENKMELYTL